MKNTGFSLVELLVVIAIMAILAGVAVPLYSTYTKNAELSVDNNYLAELLHAAQINGAIDGDEVTGIIVTVSNANAVTKVTAIIAGDNNTVTYEDVTTATTDVAGDHTFKSYKDKTIKWTIGADVKETAPAETQPA